MNRETSFIFQFLEKHFIPLISYRINISPSNRKKKENRKLCIFNKTWLFQCVDKRRVYLFHRDARNEKVNWFDRSPRELSTSEKFLHESKRMKHEKRRREEEEEEEKSATKARRARIAPGNCSWADAAAFALCEIALTPFTWADVPSDATQCRATSGHNGVCVRSAIGHCPKRAIRSRESNEPPKTFPRVFPAFDMCGF